MIAIIDQLGKNIFLEEYPKRIISLVPSQTELLFDLGLSHEVAGITKFCVHPRQWFEQKPRVGGTKTVKMEIVHSLQPDLIIANKEENTKEQIEKLTTRYPVWISDVNDLETALQMIISVGKITNKYPQATEIANKIKNDFTSFALQLKTTNDKPRVAYLIWKDPYMAVGGDTFIHSMLEACGFKNVFEHFHRYPTVSITELQNASCQWILLSSEPYPFSQKIMEALQVQLPGTKIILVDGEMFSWYGSRLVHAVSYLQKLVTDSMK